MDEENITPEVVEEPVEQSSMIDTGLNLYDVNKQLVAQMPDLTEEQIAEKKDIIRKFIRTAHHGKKFFMLLGRDLNYYTLFNRISEENTVHPYAQDEVIECLKDLGTIKAIDKINDEAIECWISNEDGVFMLMLFPYDRGVIVCQ